MTGLSKITQSRNLKAIHNNELEFSDDLHLVVKDHTISEFESNSQHKYGLQAMVNSCCQRSHNLGI